MPSSVDWGLSAAFAALAVGIYHFAVVSPRLAASLRPVTLAPGDPETAAQLRALVEASSKRTDERLNEVEQTVRRDLQRVGFVRYNSFANVGSDLSFTLALVNGDGNGVVVTSIYSREDTRTYGKSVRGFATQQEASAEELQAIAMARNGG